MIGAAALALTLIGKVIALIAPRWVVPYLSASKELSAVLGMPEQRPKSMKKRANKTGPSASHKVTAKPITGNWAKATILCAVNLSTKMPDNREPIIAAIA